MHDANAPPDRARLVLVRHCATPLNEARKYQGHEDVALSPAGREMARGMAAGFAERGIVPDRVWASDLRRAWETADLAFPGVAQQRDPRLRELNFGSFSGASYDENLAQHGDRFRAWLRDPDASPPPGGERFADLAARTTDWAESLAWNSEVVAVLHVGSLKAIVSWALGVPFGSVVPLHLPVAAVVELRVDGGRWRVVEGWDELTDRLGSDLDATDAPGEGRPGDGASGQRRPGGSAAWPGAEGSGA